jgi:RNA-directed DNA polymerase
LDRGYNEVYDADLASYFDTIPHDKLISSLKTRVSDGALLKLITMWLKAPVVDKDENGKSKWTRPKQGTPQGGVLSPLLANLYLHWFDKSMSSANSPARRVGARVIRYADDFIVTARYMSPVIVRYIEYLIEDRLGLRINREKTRVVRLDSGKANINFLGYEFRYHWDLKGGRHRYLHWGTSKLSLQRVRDRLREMTASSQCFTPVSDLLKRISLYRNGWANYFSKGYHRRSFRAVDTFIGGRVFRHLNRRSQRGYKFPKGMKLWDYLKRFDFHPLQRCQ